MTDEWNSYDDWYGSFLPTGIDMDKLEEEIKLLSECSHEWTEYIGFNNSYEFCKKCDKKREPDDR